MKLKLIFSMIVVLLLLSAVLAACGLSPTEQDEARMYATLYARDGVIPPPKYQTLAAENGYVMPMTPVPSPTLDMHYTPTMSFYDFSGTQVAQQQSIGLTSQANQAALERERIAAEARAEKEREEARQAEETAAAWRIELTAQARAAYMQATANAEGTMVMNTAVAASTGTAWMYAVHSQETTVAQAATNAVLPTHAVWTQNAVYAVATIERGEADKVALAVRRQEMKNYFDAYLPWLIIVGAIAVLGRGFGEYLKTRVHARDEHGAVPLLQMKTDNGDTVLIKAEDMETGVMKVAKDGSVIRYAPMDEREQSDIKRRNQAVEAIRALPTPYAQTGAKIVTSEFSSTHARVTVGNPTSMSPVTDEADQGLLEEIKND